MHTTNVIRHSDVSMCEVAIDLRGDLDALSRLCLALFETVHDLAQLRTGGNSVPVYSKPVDLRRHRASGEHTEHE